MLFMSHSVYGIFLFIAAQTKISSLSLSYPLLELILWQTCIHLADLVKKAPAMWAILTLSHSSLPSGVPCHQNIKCWFTCLSPTLNCELCGLKYDVLFILVLSAPSTILVHCGYWMNEWRIENYKLLEGIICLELSVWFHSKHCWFPTHTTLDLFYHFSVPLL